MLWRLCNVLIKVMQYANKLMCCKQYQKQTLDAVRASKCKKNKKKTLLAKVYIDLFAW